ncbi:hypothetical protein PFISCL1PPCAC_27668, partial [Pristionchus fissidentatus]
MFRLYLRKRVFNTLNDTVTHNHVCAGSFGHGSAPGDSGGPLMMKSDDGKWFQVGITSSGGVNELLILQDDAPGIFTNVKNYCDWIQEQTNGEVSCEDS